MLTSVFQQSNCIRLLDPTDSNPWCIFSNNCFLKLSSLYHYTGNVRLEVRRGSDVREFWLSKERILFNVVVLCACDMFKSVSGPVKSLIHSGASRTVM